VASEEARGAHCCGSGQRERLAAPAVAAASRLQRPDVTGQRHPVGRRVHQPDAADLRVDGLGVGPVHGPAGRGRAVGRDAHADELLLRGVVVTAEQVEHRRAQE
jgi:hypothetical protein